jgi:cytochrome c oxidase assembly protein subunit 15
MGVDTSTVAVAPARRRLWDRLSAPRLLTGLALASVVANVVIVVTGGAVRLTNSGLGCPTWPSCTDASLIPTKAYSFHGIIEFTNRQLTFVVGVLAVLTVVVAWRQRRQFRLSAVGFASIPAQAVLGGIVVLTHLNPWLVAAHFLLSMAIIATYLLLWWRLSGHPGLTVGGPALVLTRAMVAVTAAVLMIGTIVTGSGPHAGDLDKDGTLHRIHVKASSITQLHADAVMVLVGLTVGLVALAYALQSVESFRRASLVLLGVVLAQGVIGYTQYFLHVPAFLVGLHMLGACLVWIAALRVLLVAEPRLGVGR